MSLEWASKEQLAWERTCSPALTSDVLWKLDAYRASLFLLHCANGDVRTIPGLRADDSIVAQLLESIASISANISEGYGRWTKADRLRFLGYSLGSTRESLSWYEALRNRLPVEVIATREELIARTRALLLGLIRSTRNARRSE